MSITPLRKWDVTPIEIALDLEAPRQPDPARFHFSGVAEPRICMVAAFALTSHLKRIAAAVERVIPQRPLRVLTIGPSRARSAVAQEGVAISVGPMPSLLRLQLKLARAIEPGLAHSQSVAVLGAVRDIGESAAAYVRDFIPTNVLPTFEPASALKQFDVIDLKPIGISIYRLGRGGSPQSIVASWPYANVARGTLHLRGGP